MRVRPLMPADRPAVSAILAGCGAFTPAEIAIAEEMVEAGLAGDYTLLGAEAEDRLVGYACIGRAGVTESAWYVYWIAVAAEAQRRGAGRALQTGVEAAVAAAGGTRLVVETSGRPDYARPRHFYRSAGFRDAGRIPDFYRAGDDCLILWKPLGGGPRP